jgi:hypothetical protein
MTVLVNEVFEPVTDLSVIATIARLIYQDETHDLAVVIDLADPGSPTPLVSKSCVAR